MDAELEKKLQQDYPEFFIDLYGDMTKTCMAWGIETGNGWYQLIDDLCKQIKQTNPPKEFKFSQIKEKFGTLRIYCDGATQEIYDLIDKADRASEKICETCGKPGEIQDGRWIYVACPDHV